MDAAKDKFDDLFDKVGDKAQAGVTKAKEAASDLGDKVGVDKIREGGRQIVDSGSELASKAGDSIESATEKIVEASDKAWEKIADTSSNLYDKAKDKIEDLGEKVGDKMEDMLEKAEAMEAQEKLEVAQHPTGIYEGESHNEKLEGSLLEGTDDFFEKAEAFAEGNYDKASEGKMTIDTTDASPVEDDRPVAGFEDRDGDGDEIVDDAIVMDTEEEQE